MLEPADRPQMTKTPAELELKWRPLVQGLDEPTSTITAWVLEAVVRHYIAGWSEAQTAPPWIGTFLKIGLPVVRRTVPLLSAAPDYAEVREKLYDQFVTVIDAAQHGCVVYDPVDPGDPKISELAEVVLAARQSCPLDR